MKVLEAMKIILSLLPAIIEAVKSIEAAFPNSGKGAEKMALVRATLQAAYESAVDKLGKFEDLWVIIQPVITAVVSFANSVGLFKKS